MKIHNIDGLSQEEISKELDKGAKFVVFQYCISLLIVSFKRGGDVHFIRNGESSIKYSWGPTLVSLIFGWWGFPWGPIYTIQTTFINLSGGKDITTDILNTGLVHNQ